MIKRLIQTLLILPVAMSAFADDHYRQHSVKMKVGGELLFAAPQSWGNKPDIEHGEAVTLMRFVPAGTPREPIFAVTLSAGVPEEAPNEDTVRQVAELLREEFRETALEADIPIQTHSGGDNIVFYFTITDKEIKPREYQYLTTAVVSDGKAVISSYFFSNDGAPDYAADAMHLLESLTYVPKEDKKKKKRR